MGNLKARPLGLMGSLLMPWLALAQPAQYSAEALRPDPPAVILLAPIHEGGVRKNRGISMAPNTRFVPERLLAVGYTASNSYLNPGLFVCVPRVCGLEYEADHTGNLLSVDITHPVLEHWELGFGLGLYRMDDIPEWLLPFRLVSDEALRTFHEDLLREDSLPVLSNALDGRQVFTMTDFAGRRLTLEPETSYALPLAASLTRYLEIGRRARARMGLKVGMHLTYPLEGDQGPADGQTAFARGMDFGVSVNFTRSRRLTANLTSMFNVELARFRSDVHVVNPNSPQNADDSNRSQYALTYGLGFAGTFSARAPCAFSVSQLTSSAQIDKERGWTWDPLVFEGGNNLRGALAGANDYGVLTFGCEHRSRYFQLALVEDIGGLSEFFSDDGSGTSYDPDLSVGISATWRLGQRMQRGS